MINQELVTGDQLVFGETQILSFGHGGLRKMGGNTKRPPSLQAKFGMYALPRYSGFYVFIRDISFYVFFFFNL